MKLDHRLTAALYLTLGASVSAGAPLGRAWTEIQKFSYEDHAYVIPFRFEPPRGGTLEVIAEGFYGTHHHRTYGLAWTDSVWIPKWHIDRETFITWPCYTDSSVQMLVWRDVTGGAPTLESRSWLVTADVRGDEVTPSDTVGSVLVTGNFQCGSQLGSRRWIASSDGAVGGSPFHFPSYFTHTGSGPWRKLPVPQVSRSRLECYPQVLALTDTTALAVYTADEHLDWGIINDTGWVRPPERLVGNYPNDLIYLRRNEDGSIWLRYGTHDTVTFMRRFKDMTWSQEDTLRWAFAPQPPPYSYLTYVGPMSLDDRPLPTLSGMAYSDRNALEFVYVNIPTESGYERFERIPHSDGGGPPAVARDENGDVWLAWWKYLDGMFWNHTYTRATCSPPRLSESSMRPHLSWTLSEPAPGSYWAVLRSVDGGPESLAARVAAAAGPEMAWNDTTLPSGARAVYRIRRECRDVRYQLWSDPSSEWLPRTPVLGLSLRSANPVTANLSAQVEGASSGGLVFVFYDLQGRRLAQETALATGTGRDVVDLRAASGLKSGLYLLRVESERGPASPIRKLVVLR